MGRGARHLKEFSAKRYWDGERIEPEGESRNAPAKSERRARELRGEDGTVLSVLVSALVVLFVCEVGERPRRENFQELANLRRGLPANSVWERASNHFSPGIRFAWLRFARGLRELRYSDA